MSKYAILFYFHVAPNSRESGNGMLGESLRRLDFANCGPTPPAAPVRRAVIGRPSVARQKSALPIREIRLSNGDTGAASPNGSRGLAMREPPPPRGEAGG